MRTLGDSGEVVELMFGFDTAVENIYDEKRGLAWGRFLLSAQWQSEDHGQATHPFVQSLCFPLGRSGPTGAMYDRFVHNSMPLQMRITRFRGWTRRPKTPKLHPITVEMKATAS